MRWSQVLILEDTNGDGLMIPTGIEVVENGTGRKGGGGDIVGSRHFPDARQGVLPPLSQSTNRNFRPVDVKFGPDGTLYIADWYNPMIGHYQASFRHPDRDKTHGRIGRVTAKGRPLTPRPSLAPATIPQLPDQLKSTDRWTRHFAKRAPADQPSPQVMTALEPWLVAPELSEHASKEAPGVYQSHEVIALPVSTASLVKPEPGRWFGGAHAPPRVPTGARAGRAGRWGSHWTVGLTPPVRPPRKVATTP